MHESPLHLVAESIIVLSNEPLDDEDLAKLG